MAAAPMVAVLPYRAMTAEVNAASAASLAVQADVHLAAGDLEQACATALHALTAV